MQIAQILSKYIKSVLKEAVRSKTFNFDEFSKLANSEQMLDYASKHGLKMLGCGSSRCAFVLSSKYVLKIALNDAGVSQNLTEVDIWTDPTTKQIVAQIFRSAEDYSWIISELVRPLSTPEELEEMTGIDYIDFKEFISFNKKKSFSKTPDITDDTTKKAKINTKIGGIERFKKNRIEQIPLKYNPKQLNFLKTIVDIMHSAKLMPGDIKNFEHWGKTPSGRLVLFDYGFTDDVFLKHYQKNENKR